jgi:hypothetical protein
VTGCQQGGIYDSWPMIYDVDSKTTEANPAAKNP